MLQSTRIFESFAELQSNSLVIELAILLVVIASLARKALWQQISNLNKFAFGPKFVETLDKAVLITGCDTGFGYATAQKLHDDGYAVFATCLDAANHNFGRRIDDSHFNVLQMDVTKQSEVDEASKKVQQWLELNPTVKLWAVINNAGVMTPMVPFELLTLESTRAAFEVNYFGALRVSKAFLPLLRETKGSRLIVTCSNAAEMAPVALNMSNYCASKAAMLASFDILRCELYKFGVHVAAVCPDFYRTGIADPERNCKNFDDEWSKADAKVVEAYGGAAYGQRLRGGIQFCVNFANPDLTPVVEAFRQAVGTTRPKRRYYPVKASAYRMQLYYKIAPGYVDGVCAKMN